jgi:hypothetical protein
MHIGTSKMESGDTAAGRPSITRVFYHGIAEIGVRIVVRTRTEQGPALEYPSGRREIQPQ